MNGSKAYLQDSSHICTQKHTHILTKYLSKSILASILGEVFWAELTVTYSSLPMVPRVNLQAMCPQKRPIACLLFCGFLLHLE